MIAVNKKYLQLCPWHFQNGASFNYGDFRGFQREAQRWADSLWLFVWYITILIGMILVSSICLPRRKRAVRAMAQLGITDADVKAALQNLKKGTTAYTPSKQEREAWLSFVKESDAAADAKKAENAPKVMRVWGIVLCAMGGVAGIEAVTKLAAGASLEGDLGSMLGGTALFAGVGVFLILRANRAMSASKKD